MRTLRHQSRCARPGRRGAALLLALLLLVVLIAITIQIGVTTGTDARIARNDLTLSNMDLAIESALLQVDETLKTDGEAAAQDAGGAGGAGGVPGTAQPPASGGSDGAAGAGGAPGGAPGGEASDSRKDEWASPQRTEINEIRLRIFVQDEDSKYNVLNLLQPDEEEAKAAYDRVVRILDLCRSDSREWDIDLRTADDMTKAMLEYMTRRRDARVPKPQLLTDTEDDERGLPLSLEEFAAVPPFEEHHFRDFRDADGHVVHSIGSFLTVWSSVGMAGDLPASAASAGAAGPAGGAGAAGGGAAAGANGAGTGGSNSSTGSSKGKTTGSSSTRGQSSSTVQGSGAGSASTGGAQTGASSAGGGAGGGGAAGGGSSPTSGSGAATGSGGYAVNVNTAPASVLKGLFDDREVHPRLFDRIIEYRNLEEEPPEDGSATADEDEEPVLDEYGQEVIDRRIFDSLAELSEVEGYNDLPSEAQQKLNQLLTTTSNVFSIYVVARRSTAVEGDLDVGLSPAEMRKLEETAGDTLVRVVRSVVWRRVVDGEVLITPLVRWQVLDYLPYEVLDLPPEDR